jgi:hypothetical protein
VKTLTIILASLMLWPLMAWEFMLAVGVAHLHWWPVVPVIGYQTSLVITFLLFSMISGGTVTTAVYAKAKP